MCQCTKYANAVAVETVEGRLFSALFLLPTGLRRRLARAITYRLTAGSFTAFDPCQNDLFVPGARVQVSKQQHPYFGRAGTLVDWPYMHLEQGVDELAVQLDGGPVEAMTVMRQNLLLLRPALGGYDTRVLHQELVAEQLKIDAMRQARTFIEDQSAGALRWKQNARHWYSRHADLLDALRSAHAHLPERPDAAKATLSVALDVEASYP